MYVNNTLYIGIPIYIYYSILIMSYNICVYLI